MTTVPAVRKMGTAVSLPQQPIALPPILTEAARTEGFRNPVWVARKPLPGEKTVIERTLLELRHRDAPAPVNSIRFHVGKMLNHWNSDRLSGPEKQAIIADYEYLLRDFSEGQIAEACLQWSGESRFKPVPANIVTLATNIQARDRESIRRARVVLGLEPPRSWEKPAQPKPPEKQVEGVPGMLSALADKLAGRTRRPQPAGQGPNLKSMRDQLARDRDPAAVAKLASMQKAKEA